jgi:hypothetical protein
MDHHVAVKVLPEEYADDPVSPAASKFVQIAIYYASKYVSVYPFHFVLFYAKVDAVIILAQ